MRIMSPGMRHTMFVHRGGAMRAIVGLRERDGSTIVAIRKHINANPSAKEMRGKRGWVQEDLLERALNWFVEDGDLVAAKPPMGKLVRYKIPVIEEPKPKPKKIKDPRDLKEETTLAQLTVAVLKERLRERGLKVTGAKAQLVARLVAHTARARTKKKAKKKA